MTRQLTLEQWEAEGRSRFGDDQMVWRFVCPSCGHVASAQDYKDAGAPSNAVAFSCVGRWSGSEREAFKKGPGGPCNYAGGGLFKLNPVQVDCGDGKKMSVFEFATEEA